MATRHAAQPAASPGPEHVARHRILLARGEEMPTVYILGRIDGWGWASSELEWELSQIEEDVKIRCIISCSGGDSMEMLKIYDTLARRPGGVEVEIQGMALSAGAVISMVGNPRRMSENAFMMIHQAWIEDVRGRADDLDRMADLMRKLNERQAAIFQKATGADEETVSAWIDEETWFTAEEALAAGLITEIVDAQDLSTELPDEARVVCELRPEDIPTHAPPAFRELHGVDAGAATTEATEGDPAMSDKSKKIKPQAGGGGVRVGDPIQVQTEDGTVEVTPEAVAAVLEAQPELLRPHLESALPGVLAAALGAKSEPEPERAKPAPSPELSAVLERLDRMETAIRERDQQSRQQEIQGLLHQAQLEGRLIPALRRSFEVLLTNASDAEYPQVVEQLKTLPVLAPQTVAGLAYDLTEPDEDGEGGGERVSLEVPPELLRPGSRAEELPASVRAGVGRFMAAYEKAGGGDAGYAAMRAEIYRQAGETAGGGHRTFNHGSN